MLGNKGKNQRGVDDDFLVVGVNVFRNLHGQIKNQSSKTAKLSKSYFRGLLTKCTKLKAIGLQNSVN
jgi:hypothetical protein